MEERIDEIMQAIILQALKDNPDGLTQRQIERLVKKKMKKLKKLLILFNEFDNLTITKKIKKVKKSIDIKVIK